MGLKVVKYYLRQPCSICFEDQGYPFRKGCQMSMLIAIIVRIWRQSKMNPISYNWFYIENGQYNITRVIRLIIENSFNSKVFHSYKISSIDTDTDYYG